jgi:site-specific recombinase XerD
MTVVPEETFEIEWEFVLTEYVNFLRGCGRSENTIGIYRDQVSRFYRTKQPLWDDEKKSFLEWNGEPQIHTNHRLDSCKRFWEWAAGEGYRATNPAAKIERRATNRARTANVSLCDIEKLIQAFRDEHKAKPNQWERMRNYACILFAIGTGVRPGEGLKLRRCDFNVAEQHVVVRGEHVKTRQSRVIFIPQNKILLALLKKLIKIQEKNGFPGGTPLFSDSGGKEISSRSWFHIVDKRAKECGVRIKPYDLRHAFITHSLTGGANPYDLKEQVGHSNMEMLKRYYHSNAEARKKTANLAPLQNFSSL